MVSHQTQIRITVLYEDRSECPPCPSVCHEAQVRMIVHFWVEITVTQVLCLEVLCCRNSPFHCMITR